MEPKHLKMVARFVLIILIFVAILFVSAGTIYWPEAWLMELIYFGWAIPVMIWMRKNNPKLFEERMDLTKKSAKGWERPLLLFGTVCYFGIFLVSGLDFRFGWSEMPLYLEAAGFAGIVLAFSAMFWVMRENTYLSRVVEVREGQKVVTTGPYRYVRHPLYVAGIVYCFAIPLSLGSFYGIIPSLGLVAMLLARTYMEDKTLHEELPGYREYAQKTRYKLVPRVW